MQTDLFGNIVLKSHKNLLGYGYMGSKQKLSTKILNAINTHVDGKIHDYKFYDLCGGGGAMSCQCLRNNISTHYNELNTDAFNAFNFLLSDEDLESLNRWLSREEYYELREKENKTGLEVMLLIMYSFGFTIHKSYFCRSETEPLYEQMVNMSISDGILKAREYGKKLMKDEYRGFPTVAISRLKMNRDMNYNLGLLTSSNLSYEDVEIDNGIIYCDIPYKDTGKYAEDLNHDDFYQWALDKEYPVFISEYDMNDEFIEIGAFSHTSTLSSIVINKVVEKLYWNGVNEN
jgi:hypothetical protein